MCGRFVQVDGVWMRLEDWMRERILDQKARQVPNPYNVAPTSAVQAIAPAAHPAVQGAEDVALAGDVSDTAPVLVTARWGFDLGKKQVINTRIESAMESRLWKAPMEQGRAVVVADGFYEWGEAHRPRYITADGPMAMAALMAWRGHDGEPWQRRRLSIVTCAADETMAEVHDRMPVLLDPDGVGAWLGDDVDAALDVARPWGRGLTFTEVGGEVGKSSASGPGLIRPDPQARLF